MNLLHKTLEVNYNNLQLKNVKKKSLEITVLMPLWFTNYLNVIYKYFLKRNHNKGN